MNLVAITLILASSLLHASWNFLAKSSRDTIGYFWWSVFFGSIGYGLWLSLNGGIYLAPASYVPFAISALAEVVYFLTLIEGYSHGDLSVVYPISRGAAPLFLLLFNAVLFGERLPPLGYLGIVLLICGVYIASLVPKSREGEWTVAGLLGPLHDHAARMALVSAFFIAVYSLSDKFAVNGAGSTPPLIYNFWVYAGNAVTWGIFVWNRRRARSNLAELRANWIRILMGSVMTVGAYVAVLVAFTLTSASYVTAGRSVSVIFGALFGTLVLKEGFGRMRVLGALLMVSGLVLIALA